MRSMKQGSLLFCSAVVFGILLAATLMMTLTAYFFRRHSVSQAAWIVILAVGAVLLALAVFGLRCAVTLPGYFLLAVPAWEHSAALASLSFGRSRSPVVYGRAWWGRLAAVCVLLLAGMCAELMLSPRLVGLLAERLLAA